MNARCIRCDGEGEKVSRERNDDGGVLVTFECGDCGETWDVVF